MSNILCGYCVQKELQANRNAFGNRSVQWINLLERGVPAVCPACGPVYSVAKIVANSPQFSVETRNFAGAICAGLLLIAGVVWVDKLFTK